MKGRADLTAEESAEILRLVGTGLTAAQVGAKVCRSHETVRRIARAAGVEVATTAASVRKELTQEEADAKREELRRIHASGPQMGVCVVCGFWRRLDADGRLPLHDQGDGKCRGSRFLPLPSYTD